jgi:hypothetical protein
MIKLWILHKIKNISITSESSLIFRQFQYLQTVKIKISRSRLVLSTLELYECDSCNMYSLMRGILLLNVMFFRLIHIACIRSSLLFKLKNSIPLKQYIIHSISFVYYCTFGFAPYFRNCEKITINILVEVFGGTQGFISLWDMPGCMMAESYGRFICTL